MTAKGQGPPLTLAYPEIAGCKAPRTGGLYRCPATVFHMDVLINLSGGVDSVYALWQHVKNGGDPLLHHCHLITPSGRHTYEKQAVRRVMRWLMDHGYGAPKLVETTFAAGTAGYNLQDVEVIGFMTANVLLHPAHRDIDTVIISANSGDLAQGPGYERRVANRNTIIQTLVSDRDIRFEYPIADVSKQEMVRTMPSDLLAACWWCRRPRRNGSTCGNCRPCREVAEGLSQRRSGA